MYQLMNEKSPRKVEKWHGYHFSCDKIANLSNNLADFLSQLFCQENFLWPEFFLKELEKNSQIYTDEDLLISKHNWQISNGIFLSDEKFRIRIKKTNLIPS